jgi:hypothetical protein
MNKPANSFRCLNSLPEVTRLLVMMYVRFPLSLRNVAYDRGTKPQLQLMASPADQI